MTLILREDHFGKSCRLLLGLLAATLALQPCLVAEEPPDRGTFENGMLHAVQRIPELQEAFRLAQIEGVELFLYGGTTRSLGFYVKKQLQQKGEAFFRETTPIPLEEVVGPYSDLDLIVRGPAEKAAQIEQTLRSQFPEGERFYRWEIRTEDYLKEPWQITQGYEPISKILHGKDGLVELPWRQQAFGKSLTEQGVGEILSGEISYFRNPRYKESAPSQNGEHHELLEAMRYLRFLHEFPEVRPDSASLGSVRAIIRDASQTGVLQQLVQGQLFRNRLQTNLRKLQYTSMDNTKLMNALEEIGLADLIRKAGYGQELRTALPEAREYPGGPWKTLGRPLTVYHGTKGYKEAWSIHRGGPFVTTYSNPEGFFVTTDREFAKHYAGGEGDFVLRVTLSPEARLEEDVVWHENLVLIVRTRQAIQRIERPLTTIEVKGKLLAALAQFRDGQEESPEIRQTLEELEGRGRTGSPEALNFLLSPSFPQGLKAWQGEMFRRLTTSGEADLRQIVEYQGLWKAPPDLLVELVRHVKGLKDRQARTNLMYAMADNILYAKGEAAGPDPQVVREFLEHTLALRGLEAPLRGSNYHYPLWFLARNSSLHKLAPSVLKEFLQAVRAIEPPEGRSQVLAQLAEHPSLDRLPGDFAEEVVRLVGALPRPGLREQALLPLAANDSMGNLSRDAIEEFGKLQRTLQESYMADSLHAKLARNPSLPLLPETFLDDLRSSGIHGRSGMWRLSILMGLAENRSLSDLPPDLLQEFLVATEKVGNSERPQLLTSLARSASFDKLPSYFTESLFRLARETKEYQWREILLRNFAMNPSTPLLSREVWEDFYRTTESLKDSPYLQLVWWGLSNNPSLPELRGEPWTASQWLRRKLANSEAQTAAVQSQPRSLSVVATPGNKLGQTQLQAQALATALPEPSVLRANLEKGMLHAVKRIPELQEAFRLAQKEGQELLLYGGTTRSFGFYVKKQLQEKGEAFFRETAAIPLEEVVGPYSDLDLIVRGLQDRAAKIEQTLRSEFPEGERFYRWEIRTEDYLREPWQITQGYEPISKILFGKDGFAELDWRAVAFGKSLNEQGVQEILSGEISYVRNPRYQESEPYQKGEHHELLEAMRYLRFLHEFDGVRPEKASLEAVRKILREATESGEVKNLLSGQLFRNRFEMNLQKLQYSSGDNLRLAQGLREIGFDNLTRKLGYGEKLRVPLGELPPSSSGREERLGKPLVVYHGTKGYKHAWSIHRGGFFVTTYSDPPGVFTATNPELARAYAQGEGDFMLKITLSPEARLGEDLVLNESGRSTDVWILKSRRAIEKIERPLTALEIKGRLLGVLRATNSRESQKDAQLYLEELGARVRQGSLEALKTFVSTPLPKPLKLWRKQVFSELLVPPKRKPPGAPPAVLRSTATILPQLQPELLEDFPQFLRKMVAPRHRWDALAHILMQPWLGELPEATLGEILHMVSRTRNSEIRAPLLRYVAGSRSLAKFPTPFLDQLLQVQAKLETYDQRSEVLDMLARNPSFADLPQHIQKRVLEEAVRLLDTETASWRGPPALYSIAQNKRLAELPLDQIEMILKAASEMKGRGWTSNVFSALAGNPALAELPENVSTEIMRAVHGLERREVLEALARNPAIDKLPRGLLVQLPKEAAQLKFPNWVLNSLSFNRALGGLPPEAIDAMFEAARGDVIVYGNFAGNSSIDKLPAELVRKYLKKALRRNKNSGPYWQADLRIAQNPAFPRLAQDITGELIQVATEKGNASREPLLYRFAINPSLPELPLPILEELRGLFDRPEYLGQKELLAKFFAENPASQGLDRSPEAGQEWISKLADARKLAEQSQKSAEAVRTSRSGKQTQQRALAAASENSPRAAQLERGMLAAIERIPELREAFRLAQAEGIDLLLYGGTTRSLGFYVKKQLQQKGEAFFHETTPIPLEEVVGPYSDLDLIVRGPQEKASKIERTLRSEFPEEERFYRWEVRTEDYLREPWQITQGYEPISKILLGKDGFAELPWREQAFGKSLTEQGVHEILSGKLSYFRNPRYKESEPYRKGQHHEILEAMRVLRFLHEFDGVQPASESLQAVQSIMEEEKTSGEARKFLQNPLFRHRFRTNLRKLQHTSLNNEKLAQAMEQLGLSDVVRAAGYGKELRVPLGSRDVSLRDSSQKLGKPLVVYHGTKGYAEAWSIHRGGPFVTTYSNPQGFFVSTDRDYARMYAHGEGDYVLKIILSPEARIGPDLVRGHWADTVHWGDVFVVQTRQAIDRIERPLTSLDVKRQLLAAVERVPEPEAIEEVQTHLEELGRRVAQGSSVARRALQSLPVHQHLKLFSKEVFPFSEHLADNVQTLTRYASLVQSTPSRALMEAANSIDDAGVRHRVLESFRSETFPWLNRLLRSIAKHRSLSDLPPEVLDQFLGAVNSLSSAKDRSSMFSALVRNRFFDRFPAEYVQKVLKGIASISSDRSRAAALQTIAGKRSFRNFPTQTLQEFAQALYTLPAGSDLQSDILLRVHVSANSRLVWRPVHAGRQWLEKRLAAAEAAQVPAGRRELDRLQTQMRALALTSDNPPSLRPIFERGMHKAVQRIPELEEAFRLAQQEGVELFLYGGTTRSLGFYVKKQLGQKGEAFFRETTTIPLEEVVGPYSDLDLIVRGPQEKAAEIEQTLRSAFPEGERFYRWEVRTEDFLREPWQLTQGYEPISKILLGKDGFVEPDWRRAAFGNSLTEQGVREILSGQISYFRNPRYRNSEPNRKGEHHEILEAMRYLRFLHEFEAVQPDGDSLEKVRNIVREAALSQEGSEFLRNQLFRNRFETNLRKLLYTSLDNVSLTPRLEEVGLTELVRALGYGDRLRTPLAPRKTSSSHGGETLGTALEVYHGTKGYAEAWSIARGGFYITSYGATPGVYVTTDPERARSYAKGDRDFVLKFSLSPEAALGKDLVTSGKDVFILRSREAIQKIEKPETAIQVKAKLLRALSKWQPAQGQEEIRGYVEELKRRVQQGSIAALEALTTLPVPKEFGDPRIEIFDWLFGSTPGNDLSVLREAALTGFLERLAGSAVVAELPPEVLERFVKVLREGTGIRGYEQTKILYSLANNPAISRLPRHALDRLVALTAELYNPYERMTVLNRLAENPSIAQYPDGFLMKLLRESPYMLDRYQYSSVVETLARNPAVILVPEVQREIIEVWRRFDDSVLRRAVLTGFADNRSFRQLSLETLEEFRKLARGTDVWPRLGRNPVVPEEARDRIGGVEQWLEEDIVSLRQARSANASRPALQAQSLTLTAGGSEPLISRSVLEEGMRHAVQRIPELEEAFRLAGKEGVGLLLYGGTTRSLGFYVKKQLQQKGEAFFRETTSIPLEDVVGPYSDLDLIVRGPQEKASKIEQTLRSQFPEGERFYRWEVRTEEFLKEPWQITQGYEPISKILLGKDGFVELPWRKNTFGKSLTEQGVSEILSGEISYFRNPRYKESAPYQKGEHHEVFEVMRYLRFLHEFEGMTPTRESLEAVREILAEARNSEELQRFLGGELFRKRFEMNLRKLQYSSLDNVKLTRAIEEIGLAGVVRNVGYGKELRVPLSDGSPAPASGGQRLGQPLVVYHGTKGYKEAWSIHRGGPYITIYGNHPGFYATTKPGYARDYARNASEDFILKITLSPEARVGVDFVWVGPEVVVIRTREAIGSIERPLSTLEVKGKLQTALVRWKADRTAEGEIRELVDEIGRRAREGNVEALEHLVGLQLPRKLRPLWEENLRELTSNLDVPTTRTSVYRLLGNYDSLGGLPEGTMERFPGLEHLLKWTLRRELNIENPRDRAPALQALARNALLYRAGPELLEQLVQEADRFEDSNSRMSVLLTFASNDNLSQFPVTVLRQIFDTVAGQRNEQTRSEFLKRLAANPALPELPAEVLRRYVQELSRLDPSQRRFALINASMNLHGDDRFPETAYEWLKQQSARELPQEPAGRTRGSGTVQSQSRALVSVDRVVRGTSLITRMEQLTAVMEGRPVPKDLGWTLVLKGQGRGASAQALSAWEQEREVRPSGNDELALAQVHQRPQGVKGHLKNFGRGMGIWAAALPIADVGTALIQGRAGDIPGQLAAMAQPESLAMLGLNYGSFALAAEGVQYPMTRLAAQAANRAATQALARASGAGLEKATAEMAAKKAAAQTFKKIARFAGPAGFFAGSAAADMVMSGGHLDVERWLVGGVAFLGVHAALSATVAPLIVAGLGLSATGIGATVGVPILMLAGTMIAVSAIEMAYDYFKAHPEVLVNAAKRVAESFKDAGSWVKKGWNGLKKVKFW